MADEMVFDSAPVKQDTPVTQAAPAMKFDPTPVGEDTPTDKVPPPAAGPHVDMEPSYTGMAMNPTQSVAGPGEGNFVAENPDEQGTLATAATIGAGGAGLAAAAPDAIAAAKGFAGTPAGQDLVKLVLKHAGEKLLQGAGFGVSYAAIHKAAKLLGLADDAKK